MNECLRFCSEGNFASYPITRFRSMLWKIVQTRFFHCLTVEVTQKGMPWFRRGLAVVTAREKQQKEERLLGLWNRLARPLLGGDGLDDELPAILGIKRHFRAVQCQVHQALHVGIVQYGKIFQSDVPYHSALGLKTALRVRDRSSLKEAQRYPAGKQYDRKNRQRRSLVRPEPDHQAVVVVINHLHGPGQPLAQFGQHPSRERRDGQIVLGQERVELPFWIRREFGFCRHRRSAVTISFQARFRWTMALASGPCGIPRNRARRRAGSFPRWQWQALVAVRGASFPRRAVRWPATRHWRRGPSP